MTERLNVSESLCKPSDNIKLDVLILFSFVSYHSYHFRNQVEHTELARNFERMKYWLGQAISCAQ